MGDEERTIKELGAELAILRQRIRQLEKIELEHQETLEDLREREANYRLLFSAETDAIIIVDAETERVTDANEAAEKLYGYSRREFLKLSATDLSAEPSKSADHIREVAAGSSAVAARGPVHRFHKRRDGTVISVEISSGAYSFRDRKMVCAIIRDVTDRRRTERALLESEARYRGIVEHTINGVAVYRAIDNGEDFLFVDFNRSAERIEKIERGEVIGKSVLAVFPGVKDFGLLEVMQRVWRTGKPEHHPVSMYKDERIIGWRDNFVYKLPSGEIVAVYSDETERKQREEALHKAHGELFDLSQELEKKVQERTAELRDKSAQLVKAERLAAVGRMANRVAHELRNPLTVVGGFARRTYNKTAENDPNRRYLEIIVDEVSGLERKVSQLIRTENEE
jgi:PAS domain S-box-containing protein